MPHVGTVPYLLVFAARVKVLSNFLHQNGFTRVNERDKAGWSPLLYAALGGNPAARLHNLWDVAISFYLPTRMSFVAV